MSEYIKKECNDKKFNILKLAPPQLFLLGFASLIVFGSLLLSLPFATVSGASSSFINSFFTSTSAVCVTGLVVQDTGSFWSPFGQTIIIILIQMGGLGIMSMATMVSLILGRKVGLRERLAIQESLNEFSLQGIVKLLKTILISTLVIEAIGAIILSFKLIPIYGIGEGIAKSAFHSISAFCNAGFDIFGTNAAPFTSLTTFNTDPIIILTIASLFIIGGLGFIVWKDVYLTKKYSRFMLHTKIILWGTLGLIVIGTLLIFIFETNNPDTLAGMSFGNKLLNSFFHSATPRTAGFNTLDTGSLTGSSKIITLLLMFIGAAPGSTGGGIKITTFVIVILAVISYIKGQEDLNLFQRKIPGEIIRKATVIFIMGIAVIFITTLVLVMNNSGDLMQSLFESVSAFGTVGLSTGITTSLNTISKIMIIITMFIGRLGPITIALSLSLHQKGKDLPYKYPDGKITVG